MTRLGVDLHKNIPNFATYHTNVINWAPTFITTSSCYLQGVPVQNNCTWWRYLFTEYHSPNDQRTDISELKDFQTRGEYQDNLLFMHQEEYILKKFIRFCSFLSFKWLRNHSVTTAEIVYIVRVLIQLPFICTPSFGSSALQKILSNRCDELAISNSASNNHQ